MTNIQPDRPQVVTSGLRICEIPPSLPDFCVCMGVRGLGEVGRKEGKTIYVYIDIPMKLYKHSKADTASKELGCIPRVKNIFRVSVGKG